ncbi:MAG: hypothetical protein H0U65_11655 [Rubrobacter sp.]|jgi:hypothetical protein|nr:hypothetical protein [Rubrobacter sp.]
MAGGAGGEAPAEFARILSRIVAECLEPDPEERPPVAELSRRLGGFVENQKN